LIGDIGQALRAEEGRGEPLAAVLSQKLGDQLLIAGRGGGRCGKADRTKA